MALSCTGLALILLLGSSPASVPGELTALLASGDAAFQARGDLAQLSAALDAFHRAAKAASGNPAIELRLARAEAFRALADPTAKDGWPAVARAAERALRRTSTDWARAIDAGVLPDEAVAKVGPAGAEPLYWLAVATYSGAQQRGFAALLAVKDAALAMMERVVQLDETLDRAGPRRVLGGWLAALPIAAGGSAAFSRKHFDRARVLAPSFQLGRVREAETLCVLLQDRRRFEALLGEVLAFDEATAPEVAPENRIAKQRARELLARKENLF